jgi:tRNA pseudouridine55 synthase
MTDLHATPPTDAAAAPAATRALRPARVKIVRRPVHGVLLLDKPLGLSSNDALQKAKWLLRAEKAGHTGTLDPLATGLLPLCFGAATKFAQVSLDSDKAYRATIRFGQTTRTGDAEGDILQERPVAFDRAALEAACAAWTGPIRQLPPMYSALKHHGKALYEYARDGVEIERAERDVTIHTIEITQWHPENPATATIEVRCSKGTYVRTLAESIGQTLGCGAHLVGLRRTASGPLKLDAAVTLEALEAMTESQRETCLLHPDTLLAEWPAVRLDANEAARFLTGLRRRTPEPDCAHLRVYGPEPHALLGSAHITAGELIADRLLSPTEVQGLPTELNLPRTT